MIKLMYITNRPEIVQIAENAGVDWIFVDMEFIGKDIRQTGLDTVQNHHTVEDVVNIKAAVHKAKVLVRVNPIHNARPDLPYPASKEEIDAVVEAGADIIMLPFFKTIGEVVDFLSYVDGRAKTCLLLETPEAAKLLEQIVEIPGIDMIHIGLNDMHLALKMKFMFQLLADGSVDKWAHYRLGSQMVILSRSFCNTDKILDLDEVQRVFMKGLKEIRLLEEVCLCQTADYFEKNRIATRNKIREFVK